MTAHHASIGPPRSGASVGILIGQSAFHSATLLRARQWAQAVVTAAGGVPIVQLGYFSPDPGDAAGVIQAWSRQAMEAVPALSVLDTTLGGLRGHTLVWIGRGAGAPGQGGGAALALYSVAREPSPGDTLLDEQALAALQVVGDDVRTAASDARARGFAALAAAVRRSVFDRLVLLGCGGGPALDGLAGKLRAIVDRPVYFSRRPVTFSTDAAPRAVVSGAHGVPWFGPATARVELATRNDGFFAGTEGRVP